MDPIAQLNKDLRDFNKFVGDMPSVNRITSEAKFTANACGIAGLCIAGAAAFHIAYTLGSKLVGKRAPLASWRFLILQVPTSTLLCVSLYKQHLWADARMDEMGALIPDEMFEPCATERFRCHLLIGSWLPPKTVTQAEFAHIARGFMLYQGRLLKYYGFNLDGILQEDTELIVRQGWHPRIEPRVKRSDSANGDDSAATRAWLANQMISSMGGGFLIRSKGESTAGLDTPLANFIVRMNRSLVSGVETRSFDGEVTVVSWDNRE